MTIELSELRRLIELNMPCDVETRLFEAINVRIRERIEAHGGWRGYAYELVTGGDDAETSFAPIDWTDDGNGNDEEVTYHAYFELGYLGGAEDSWLRVATDLHQDSSLCLFFDMLPESNGLDDQGLITLYNDFFDNTPALDDAGFLFSDGCICLPFVLNTDRLAEEYPDDFDLDKSKTLAPLDVALDTMFKNYRLFDPLVKM